MHYSASCPLTCECCPLRHPFVESFPLGQVAARQPQRHRPRGAGSTPRPRLQLALAAASLGQGHGPVERTAAETAAWGALGAAPARRIPGDAELEPRKLAAKQSRRTAGLQRPGLVLQSRPAPPTLWPTACMQPENSSTPLLHIMQPGGICPATASPGRRDHSWPNCKIWGAEIGTRGTGSVKTSGLLSQDPDPPCPLPSPRFENLKPKEAQSSSMQGSGQQTLRLLKPPGKT